MIQFFRTICSLVEAATGNSSPQLSWYHRILRGTGNANVDPGDCAACPTDAGKTWKNETATKDDTTSAWGRREAEAEQQQLQLQSASNSRTCLDPSKWKLRRHKDCLERAPALCSRSVWECPGKGYWFTFPEVSEQELATLYKTAYHAQAKLSIDDGRVVSQSKFIRDALVGEERRDPRTKLRNVMELGCAEGWLLARLVKDMQRKDEKPTNNEDGAASKRSLADAGIASIQCFEATPGFPEKAQENIGAQLVRTREGEDGSSVAAAEQNDREKVHIYPSLYDAGKIADGSIDLFLSSHVLEHLGNLPRFLRSELYPKMRHGGLVFSEVPNHDRQYILKTFGGQFHLTFPTPEGIENLFRDAGFEPVKSWVGDGWVGDGWVGDGGLHIRTIHRKPDLDASKK